MHVKLRIFFEFLCALNSENKKHFVKSKFAAFTRRFQDLKIHLNDEICVLKISIS